MFSNKIPRLRIEKAQNQIVLGLEPLQLYHLRSAFSSFLALFWSLPVLYLHSPFLESCPHIHSPGYPGTKEGCNKLIHRTMLGTNVVSLVGVVNLKGIPNERIVLKTDELLPHRRTKGQGYTGLFTSTLT